MFFTDILTVSVSDSHCTILKMKDLPVPEDALHDDVSRFFFFFSFLHYTVFLSFAFLENFPNLTRLLLCVFFFFVFLKEPGVRFRQQSDVFIRSK